MVGIYKITNKSNGKSYIGQSNDIERRFYEHKNRINLPIDIAIHKYGADTFEFAIIEECDIALLDEREIYWIEYYDTYRGFGYNCNPGGGINAGEYNGRTKLTNEDVEYIRDCYNTHCRRKDVYAKFQDKISFSAFASIWDGTTWKHIKPEVYTEENKRFYKFEATNGEKSAMALLTDEDVMNCRKRYVNESAKIIYQDYSDKVSYQTFQQMLWGRTFKHLPIYKKKEKKWVNK